MQHSLTPEAPTRDVAIDLEPHLPLVAHVVRQVALRVPGHVDRSVLWRHGAMGLAVAARSTGTGAGFGTQALRAVRAQIVQALREDLEPPSDAQLARMLGVDLAAITLHQGPLRSGADAPTSGNVAGRPGEGRMPVEPSPVARQQRLAHAIRPAWVAVQS